MEVGNSLAMEEEDNTPSVFEKNDKIMVNNTIELNQSMEVGDGLATENKDISELPISHTPALVKEDKIKVDNTADFNQSMEVGDNLDMEEENTSEVLISQNTTAALEKQYKINVGNTAELNKTMVDVNSVVTSNNEDLCEAKCSDSPKLSEDKEEEIYIVYSEDSNETIADVTSVVAANNEDLYDAKCLDSPKLSEDKEEEIDVVNSHDSNVLNESLEDEIRSEATNARSRELINQSLSLPYYKISRPDFHEFTSSVAKNLEVPMQNQEQDDELQIVKDLFLPEEGQSARLLNFKCKKRHAKEEHSDKQNSGGNEIRNKENEGIVVLWAGKSEGMDKPSSSKRKKESTTFQRGEFMRNLQDQMQKKKEEAFDRHKKMEQADEEICDNDSEEHETACESLSINPIRFAASSETEKFSEDYSKVPVASTSAGTFQGDINYDLELINKKHDEPESFGDFEPVSLSLPSYQPGGGFINHYDTSNESDSSDCDIIEDVRNSTYGKKPEYVACEPEYENSSKLEASQSADDVSTICSGRFLTAEDERPWSPTFESQINRQRETGNGSNFDDGNDNENLDSEKSQFKDSHDLNLLDDKVPKRKRENFPVEDISPPLKKYQSEEAYHSSQIASPPKLNNIMKNVYRKFSVNDDPSIQNTSSDEEKLRIDDIEEEEFAPLIKKCKPIDDSDEEEEEKMSIDNQLDKPSSQNEIDSNDSIPHKMKDFFDNEAELSGEEMSADESDYSEGNDEPEEEQIPDDVPANEAELKEQVFNIHFKHERDEDAKLVKKLQQDFLPEGELHVDGNGRQKNFFWKNNDASNTQTEMLSESEPEDISESANTQDKIKWRQETAVVQNIDDNESTDVNAKEKSGNAKKLPVSIVGRAHSSNTNIGAQEKAKKSHLARPRGSLIDAPNSDGLNLNVSGSVQRKTVLFQTMENKNNDKEKSSKGPKEESIFSKLL